MFKQLRDLICGDATVHGKVVLSSGEEADWYADLRQVTLSGTSAPLVGRVMRARVSSSRHQHVALVRYNEEGRHEGEAVVDDTAAAGHIAAAELAWQLGVPFTEWWAAHPPVPPRITRRLTRGIHA